MDMTDEERSELVQRLQDDLEDFVAERSRCAREKRENDPEDEKTVDEIAEECCHTGWVDNMVRALAPKLKLMLNQVGPDLDGYNVVHSAPVSPAADGYLSLFGDREGKAVRERRWVICLHNAGPRKELLNHPAFMTEIDWSKPLSPEMQGLMAIKYESENPVARADSYREEGNDLFKKKDYRLAIDNYTEGIKAKSPDRDQNAVLYTNRAAAHYHLGNYRSAFNDCILARKFKIDHLKAIVRGAQCSEKMKKHDDTIRWCKAGLLVQADHKEFSEMKKRAEKAKQLQERDERKQAFKEKKEEEATLKLLEVIKSRHIQLQSIPQKADTAHLKPSLLVDLDPIHPSGARVHLDDKGVLHWPVLFLYPEYGQTDFIQAVCENDRIEDHLVTMFGPGVEPAVWDIDRKYTPDRIQVFFEDQEEETLYPVSKLNTLLEVLQHKKYKVFKGTPAFIIVVNGSEFKEKFTKQYKMAT